MEFQSIHSKSTMQTAELNSTISYPKPFLFPPYTAANPATICGTCCFLNGAPFFLKEKELKAFSCKRQINKAAQVRSQSSEFTTRSSFLRKASLKLPAVHYWERAFSRSYHSLHPWIPRSSSPECAVPALLQHSLAVLPLQLPEKWAVWNNEECLWFIPLCCSSTFSPVHPSVVTSLSFPQALHPSQANTFEYKAHLELNISYTLTGACFPTE